MRIGIEASSLVNDHPTGLEHSLEQLLPHLAGVSSRHEYVLQFNFVRRRCAQQFERRIGPLLGERLQARICRVPARWMQRFGGWCPIDWTLGGCDVVHYPFFPLRRQQRGARVVTVHDLIPLTHPEHCEPQLVEAFARQLPAAVEQADAIISVSEYTKTELVERLGVAAERIRTVHHGVDPRFQPAAVEAVAELRERLNLERPYLLALGVGDPRKNLLRLVEAFALARERGLAGVELVLAGKLWKAPPALRARIAELGLASCVRLLGYVAEGDLPVLYAGAAAFAMPSLAEGFGLPILEAMACGTPVIAARTTSLPEVAGDAALLVEPTSVEALRDAILRVLDDSGERRALVARGHERAARFRWERSARDTVSVYEAAA